MTVTPQELEFIALAGKDMIRKVASPEGAKYYGQPIGSIITADMEKAKKAENSSKGINAPKNGLSSSPSISGAKAVQKSSSISGPKTFKVGEARYSAPVGSLIVRPKNSPNIAYVKTPDGEIHAFNQAAELEIPEDLKEILEQKFSKNFDGDALYTVDDFDGDDVTLSELDPGAQLLVKDQVAFEKQPNGVWKNPLIGTEVTDADLQPAFEKGKYSLVYPATTAEEFVDYSSLTQEELESVLSTLPDGKEIYAGEVSLKKQKDGKWLSGLDGAVPVESTYVAQAFANTSILKDKKPEPKIEEGSSVVKAYAEVRPTPGADGEPPRQYFVDEINDFPVGTELEEVNGSGDVIEVWVKQEDDSWWAADGVTTVSANDLSEYGTFKVAKEGKTAKEEAPTSSKSSEVPSGLPKNSVNLESFSELDDVPIGETIYVEGTSDGNYLALEKIDAELWQSESGYEFTSNDLSPDVESGWVWKTPSSTKSSSEESQFVSSPPKGTVAVQNLSVFTEGKEIWLNTGSALGYLPFKKSSDSTWLSPSSSFETWELELDAVEGNVWAVPELEESKPEPEETYSSEQPPGTMSTDQVESAIAALESHSGFQIKYGLKSLPDNHPLKSDQDYLDTAVQEAKDAFPELAPKKALIAHLKSGIGIDPFPQEEAQTETTEQSITDDGEQPKILIGAEKSKTTQTGETGGMFTAAEIQEAISILESYDGKIFKSELNKKGSPLGKLSPNDIVGFNKDKLITKQNFIDLLKKKIADNSSSQSISETDSGASGSSPGAKITSLSEFSQLPAGSTVLYKSDIMEESYLKRSNNLWYATSVDFGLSDESFYSSIEKGQIFDTSPASTSTNVDGVVTDTLEVKITSLEDLDALPVGTSIEHTLSKSVLTKTEKGTWKSNSSPIEVQSSFFDGMFSQLKIVQTPEASDENSLKPGYVFQTVEELDILPPGSSFKYASKFFGGILFTKTQEGFWRKENGVQLSSESLDYPISKGKITYVSGPMGNVMPTNADDSSIEAAGKPKIENVDNKKSAPEDNTVIDSYYVLTSPAELEELSPGSVVQKYVDGGENDEYFVKQTDGSWYLPKTDKSYDDDESFFAQSGQKYVWSVPKEKVGQQEYQKPTASEAEQNTEKLSEPLSLDDLKNSPLFTIVTTESGYVIQKVDFDSWQAWLSSSNAKGGLVSSGVLMDAYGSYGGLKKYDGLYPAKYNSGKGAKTQLYVNSDGTGTFVGMKGVVKSLSSKDVNEYFDSGMSFLILDGSTPPDSTDGSSSATVKPSAVKKVGDISQLPDGKYFLGDPENPKTHVYEVKGDKAKLWKPKTSFGDISIGMKANSELLEAAPIGSEAYSSYWYQTTAVKNEEGVWVDKANNQPTSYMNGWYATKWKITYLGKSEPVEIDKSKLKTNFLKGALVDSSFTSVVPDDYSGAVKFLGASASIPDLVKVKDSDSLYQSLKSLGMDPKLLAKEMGVAYSNLSLDDAQKYLKTKLDKYLETVDTSIPEGVDAPNIFTFDEMGQPHFPDELFGKKPSYYSYTTGELTAKIKEYSAYFGDGTVIGQLPTTMSKDQKLKWFNYLYNGNFAEMYNLETSAAVAKGKSLPKGYMHPGYTENTATHKIAWGPAVPGEISSGTKIEGNWSNVPTSDWSMAEIDNYLIKAQMLNPEYLNGNEKRNWVHFHKAGSQDSVDSLSVVASLRKKNSEEKLSPAPQWTDNIIPAKSYDSMFDDTQFPLNWGTFKAKALDWYNDNVSNIPELEAAAKAKMDSIFGGSVTWDGLTTGNQRTVASAVVQDYFQKLHDDFEAEKLKPVYTKESGQTKGSHPGANYTDQFGTKYYFKWWNNPDKLSNYRLEIEHAGNKIGRAFGFQTSDSKLLEIDGTYGQLQTKVKGGVGDMTGFDYSSITSQMLADVEGEHLLDWVLQNDDTKADNAIITDQGRIVGIDKARSFKDYGAVDWVHGAPDGNLTIYQRLYSAIGSKQISKEVLDEAFLRIRKTALRMERADSQVFESLITEGSKNRELWTVDYSIDGKKVSQDLSGLLAAFNDRKSKLLSQVESEWGKLYSDLGYELPEPPAAPLDETISGIDDDRLYENLISAKTFGVSTMVSGSSAIGGTLTVWTDGTKGSDDINLNGEMFIAPKAQQKLLNYLQANALGGPEPSKAQAEGFSQHDAVWNALLPAVKTINTHAGDGAYNAGSIAYLEGIRTSIEKDLEAWSPNLVMNSELNGIPSYAFPSGQTIPEYYVDQYKLMLDYYQPKVEEAWSKYQAKETIDSTYEQFSAFNIKNSDFSAGKFKYVNGDQTVWKLSNAWILNDGSNLSILDLYAGESLVSSEGWSLEKKAETEKDATAPAVKIVHLNGTHEKSATFGPDGQKITDFSSKSEVSGSPGTEFEITLPSGEVIYFRNADHTDTKKAQQGRLSFFAAGVGNDVQSSKDALIKIQDHLASLGIEFDVAEEEDAELVYWREMFGILKDRNHKPGSAYEKAYADLTAKVKEIKSKEETFIEDFAEVASVSEQNTFWRELWGKHFGSEKVNSLISTRSYLPKYDHQNLDAPEVETGKPYWERLDVTIEELTAKNFLIASKLGKEPTELVKSGGALGAEERLRIKNDFNAGGAAWSAGSDQSKGSSHNIYTRLIKNVDSDYNAYYNPRALLRTRTYSFPSDMYGNKASRKEYAPSSPLDAVSEWANPDFSGNETSLPHAASLLDAIEIYAFEYANEREEAIQFLKARGIETIRGLPIEDRLVMRTNLKAAIAKVRETWKT